MTNTPPEPPSDPTPGDQPYGSAPDPYGPPQPGPSPYGQPPYGQVPYGQLPPAYGGPGAPGGGEPSKGLAIAALVLAVVGCFGISWLLSVVLAVVVLVQSRSGAAGGRGLAIAALVIDAIWALVTLALVVLVVVIGVTRTGAEDLESGQCLNAAGIHTDEDVAELDDIEVVTCSKAHDAEVLATLELSESDVDGYSEDVGIDLCLEAILREQPEAARQLQGGQLLFIAFADFERPDAGDALACLVVSSDGSKLQGPLSDDIQAS